MIAIGAYPLWSVTVLVVDALIVHALTVRAFRRDAPARTNASVERARL